jgi:hypothetical protein
MLKGFVLDLVSQVRDVVLMNVYLDLGNPGGLGFWDEGYMSKGKEMGRSVYEQPGNEVDGSYHSKEGSKLVKGGEWGAKGNEEKGKQKARGLLDNAL